MSWRIGLMALAAAVAGAAPAAAQGKPRVEVGVGVLWTPPYASSTAAAMETPNPTAGAAPLTLFSTAARVREGAGLLVRFTARVARRVSVEAEGRFSRPVLSARLSGDFESAPDTTVEERLTQYSVGGSVLVDAGAGGRRLRPFVAAGAGYLRQLEVGNASVDGGMEWHAGGGVRFRLASRVSLRADARVLSTDQSAAFEVKRRYLPQVSSAFMFGL